jgi:hypothetical protein
MPTKEKISFKKFLYQNTIWVVGLAMAIINLWLAFKLSPISESVIKLNGRVSAVEQSLTQHQASQTELFDQIIIRIDHISSRVDLLVSKLIP